MSEITIRGVAITESPLSSPDCVERACVCKTEVGWVLKCHLADENSGSLLSISVAFLRGHGTSTSPRTLEHSGSRDAETTAATSAPSKTGQDPENG